MDKKELQRKIISGVLGEEQYQKVSFLEPIDFTDYGKGADFRRWWNFIEQNEGSYAKILRSLSRKEKFEYLEAMELASLSDYSGIDRLGLLLLEINWREYLKIILLKSTEKTTDELELNLIMKVYHESDAIDVFDLLDWVPEYMEPHLKNENLMKIRSWKEYAELRIKKIKECQVLKAS